MKRETYLKNDALLGILFFCLKKAKAALTLACIKSWIFPKLFPL